MGSESAAMRSASRLRPRFQVTITVKTPTATVSGNHPPCAILVEHAMKNDKSKQRNSARHSPARQMLQCHRLRHT